MFALLKKKNPHEQAAVKTYADILMRARAPEFYRDYGIPDSFDGRFDLLTLHAFLIINRFKDQPDGQDFNQALFDAIFADMDQTLREAGIGDMGVPKRMRKMMKAFNGRMHAYEESFSDDAAFTDALRRNLYGTIANPPQEKIEKIMNYAREAAKALAGISLTEMAEGSCFRNSMNER